MVEKRGLSRKQLRKKAYETAASLIQTMDLECFWGEDILDCNSESILAELQAAVVWHLRQKEASLNG